MGDAPLRMLWPSPLVGYSKAPCHGWVGDSTVDVKWQVAISSCGGKGRDDESCRATDMIGTEMTE